MEVHAHRYVGPVIDDANPLRRYFPSLVNSRTRRRGEDRDPASAQLPPVGIQCVLPREGHAKAVEVLGTVRLHLRVHANQVISSAALVEVEVRDDWPAWQEAVQEPGTVFARRSRFKERTADDIVAGYVEAFGRLEADQLDLSGILNRALAGLPAGLRQLNGRVPLPATSPVQLRAAVRRLEGEPCRLTLAVGDERPLDLGCGPLADETLRSLEHIAAHELVAEAANDSVRKQRATLERVLGGQLDTSTIRRYLDERFAFLASVEPAWHLGHVHVRDQIIPEYGTVSRLPDRWQRTVWMYEQVGALGRQAGVVIGGD